MKPNHQIKAVLWDMDGVLIDSEPFYNITTGRLIESLGRPFDEVTLKKITGAAYWDLPRTLELDISVEDFRLRYIDALIEAVQNVTSLIDGVADFLLALKEKGIKLAIGTSSPFEVLKFIDERFLVSRYMDAFVTSTDIKKGKPAPDIYLKCAELLDVRPENCMVIEDSLNGVKSGIQAGMAVCAFTGTAHHHFDLSDADFEITAYGRKEMEIFDEWLEIKLEIKS